MKKILCIVLAAIVLFITPVRGYSAGVTLPFGIGEEIILPFLLSLLGVKAAESINTYNDLVTYNGKIKGSLLEKVSGLAGMEQVQEWLFNVVNGVIDTDSIIWEKLYEYAVSNYISSGGIVDVTNTGITQVGDFSYYITNSVGYNTGTFVKNVSCERALSYYYINSSNQILYRFLSCSTVRTSQNTNSYTKDNKTVYWSNGGIILNSLSEAYPVPINDEATSIKLLSSSYAPLYAWVAMYGEYYPSNENIGAYSDAFDSVLTSSEKDDIVDGTSVIQLYNPAELQNGLEIIPGGDPEDDPNLKKIPFAVTADWWNFLQQFGSGVNSNQYVNAYNALNGLENTSVGRISDAYDSLGIASIAGSAANAAEGIISLTDDNIYPASQTAADAITNTIPGSLTPQIPDSGIDNESPQGLYKLPDLREYFPFCIPFDLIDLLRCFVAEPETPSFVLVLSTGSEMSQQSFDLHMWDNIASMVRTFELVGFILGLILVTRNIIRG